MWPHIRHHIRWDIVMVVLCWVYLVTLGVNVCCCVHVKSLRQSYLCAAWISTKSTCLLKFDLLICGILFIRWFVQYLCFKSYSRNVVQALQEYIPEELQKAHLCTLEVNLFWVTRLVFFPCAIKYCLIGFGSTNNDPDISELSKMAHPWNDIKYHCA